MDGLFNLNFVLGMVLAKDRPQDEAIRIALTAGQFPQNSLVGPLMLKTEVDKVDKAENDKFILKTLNLKKQGKLDSLLGALQGDNVAVRVPDEDALTSMNTTLDDVFGSGHGITVEISDSTPSVNLSQFLENVGGQLEALKPLLEKCGECQDLLNLQARVTTLLEALKLAKNITVTAPEDQHETLKEALNSVFDSELKITFKKG